MMCLIHAGSPSIVRMLHLVAFDPHTATTKTLQLLTQSRHTQIQSLNLFQPFLSHFL